MLTPNYDEIFIYLVFGRSRVNLRMLIEIMTANFDKELWLALEKAFCFLLVVVCLYGHFGSMDHLFLLHTQCVP